MNNEKNNIGRIKKSLYCGFSVLGGTISGMYGFTANRFRLDEIIFLILGGIIAGIAATMIFCGIVSLLKD